jgi:hypothetical protein
MMPLKPFIVFTLLLFASIKTVAQTEIITIDPSAAGGAKNMPYDKEFYIKIPVDGKAVFKIYIIKRHKNLGLEKTISHYVDNHPRYEPDTISLKYVKIHSNAGKDTLSLRIADEYLLKPSQSYYIIIFLKKLNDSTVKFFDYTYLSQYGQEDKRKENSGNALKALTEYDKTMKEHYGDNLIFGNYTLEQYKGRISAFLSDFKKEILPDYKTYTDALHTHLIATKGSATNMAGSINRLELITRRQLYVDTAINKEVISYLMRKESLLNNLISDLNTLISENRLDRIINGSISINCITCDSINTYSPLQKDLNKRMVNIDSTTEALINLKRAFFLLSLKAEGSESDLISRNALDYWIKILQDSKNQMKEIIMLKEKSENKIISSYFDSLSFIQPLMIGGNTFLNFETRSNALLSPDFGIITSSITSKGKQLDYYIIPYLGFHINFMPLDRDIPFSSYKKNWKQSFSLMVGWSLTSIKKDSTSIYENFFEKSTLLTGMGYRLSHTLRLNAGCQWLFKTNTDVNNINLGKKLLAYPYVGLSIDLNIKKYLNGFAEILTSIGVEKKSSNSITNIISN